MIASLIFAASAVTITFLLCTTALRALRMWLDFRRCEGRPGAENDVGLRIELSAVKERLKKLEAIASGVEL